MQARGLLVIAVAFQVKKEEGEVEDGEIKDIKEEKPAQKVPLSLEELLAKKKAEEDSQSKVGSRTQSGLFTWNIRVYDILTLVANFSDEGAARGRSSAQAC